MGYYTEKICLCINGKNNKFLNEKMVVKLQFSMSAIFIKKSLPV